MRRRAADTAKIYQALIPAWEVPVAEASDEDWHTVAAESHEDAAEYMVESSMDLAVARRDADLYGEGVVVAVRYENGDDLRYMSVRMHPVAIEVETEAYLTGVQVLVQLPTDVDVEFVGGPFDGHVGHLPWPIPMVMLFVTGEDAGTVLRYATNGPPDFQQAENYNFHGTVRYDAIRTLFADEKTNELEDTESGPPGPETPPDPDPPAEEP